MNKERQKNIRNFAIIAHIDHGKSTLSDRFLEITDSVSDRDMKDQLLDSMDLEREKGITIKLNAVQMKYLDKRTDEEYVFHLIDTPGHVDFTYEVSRSLAACEGAILVVDATQGVQPQTLANVYLALENNLEIIPVINKIDMPAADVEKTINEIEETIGIDCSDAPQISAKSGLNVNQVIDQVINKFPSPVGDVEKPLKALVFDSYYDSYRGVVIYTRIFDGEIKKGDKIRFLQSGLVAEVNDVGVKRPKEVKTDVLRAGEVGWISSSIKKISLVNVGDTITIDDRPTDTLLPGYKKVQPVVFSGFYPLENAHYTALREALEKLVLSDSALVFEKESSLTLGHGFRVGFLGLLHLDIIRERIEREFNIPIIPTAPSVKYVIKKTNGEIINIDNPSDFPEAQLISKIEEPYVKIEMMSPKEYIGSVMQLCQERRGKYLEMRYIDDKRQFLIYEIPISEIIFDFFNKLKSISKGYATFSYEEIGLRESKLVKVDMLLNSDKVDALSFISTRDTAYYKGRELCKRLKEVIPKQNFEIPIQASIGSKIIARETVRAYRKDVIAKCYGGDITRKRKLLEKQKAGKKKMKQFGTVEIPQEAFISIIKATDD